jgi:hypothetical protein
MARAMYPHELGDTDFSWLLSVFLESHPQYFQVESSCIPVVLIERGLGMPILGDEFVRDVIKHEEEEDKLNENNNS